MQELTCKGSSLFAREITEQLDFAEVTPEAGKRLGCSVKPAPFVMSCEPLRDYAMKVFHVLEGELNEIVDELLLDFVAI